MLIRKGRGPSLNRNWLEKTLSIRVEREYSKVFFGCAGSQYKMRSHVAGPTGRTSVSKKKISSREGGHLKKVEKDLKSPR